MSWSISAVGTKKGVIKHVEQASFHGHDTEKELILTTIGHVPDGSGVSVQGNGHRDSRGYCSVTLQISPCVLVIDAESPDAVPA